MRVLVACEFSGIVRDAFARNGHEAWSCDLIESETKGNHLIRDVKEVLYDEWDLMIAHPPCTHLSASGARWFCKKKDEQKDAIDFVRTLMKAPIPMIAIENPIGIISTSIRKFDQLIHPWMFGHGEKKATCLWLKNLPKLIPTNVVDGREGRILSIPDRKNRWKDRSRFYPGIAEAMANQWG